MQQQCDAKPLVWSLALAVIIHASLYYLYIIQFIKYNVNIKTCLIKISRVLINCSNTMSLMKLF